MKQQNFRSKTADLAWRRSRMLARPHTSLPPGYFPEIPGAAPTKITLIRFKPDAFEEHTPSSPDTIHQLVEPGWITWINLEGLGDTALLKTLGECFDLHPLALEEAAQTGQRPKAEDYGRYTFILARALMVETRLTQEQISLFLGKDFVLTFEEGPSFVLNPVRERLRRGTGKIRDMGADYLAYALLDAIVDGYYPALDELLGRLNGLEEHIIHTPKDSDLNQIHDLKRELLEMRQSVWPLREAVGNLLHDSTSPFGDQTRVFMRDCFDHLHQIMEMLEVCRELTSDLMALYLSHTNNRTSEVMRVLTIITTLFMPMTFITSVYGMNFNTHESPYNMPELNWRYGYLAALGAITLVVIVQIGFFWSKGWIDIWPFNIRKK